MRGSCGCTVGKDWPKHPVKPNERATISISFDSEGRNGRQDKTATVAANTSPPSNVLTLSAEADRPHHAHRTRHRNDPETSSCKRKAATRVSTS
ncbi:MAG: DUF1573 domain-containing protein [Flavobacteriales bacterium]|nr:DUF1573 domain-containing protein [Flavobacteriales bacterium]